MKIEIFKKQYKIYRLTKKLAQIERKINKLTTQHWKLTQQRQVIINGTLEHHCPVSKFFTTGENK